MTDLTYKWKKGELPAGWYWIKGSRAEGIYAYTAEYLNNMYRPRNGEKIIEQVPSYEELQNINKSVNDLMATNIKLVEENTKLKELLKECRIANETFVGIMDWLRQSVIPEQREICEKLFVKVQKLQTLIDEMLK